MDTESATLPDAWRVEVFRRAYGAVGWGWLVAPTTWPLLRGIADAAYRVFARNRLGWTGRADACAGESCKPRIDATDATAGGTR